MKSGFGDVPFPPPLFSGSGVETGGGYGGGTEEGPPTEIEQKKSKRKEKGRSQQGNRHLSRPLRVRRSTKGKKTIEPWWKTEIILIRSDSACQ